jgi:phosphatidate phosphatase PAH1
MRNLSILLVAMLCTSCALQTFDIQKAPLKPNQAVVFDIDGTLTPKQSAIFTARDDAASGVRLFADSGYKIIYLSARTRLLQSGIPDWLKENHFPEGSIHVPQTATDSSDHAAFKKRILKEFQKNGWNFFAAYGDSSTDFEAYAEVGIDKDHVFALRPAGKTSCQPGIWAKCFSSWVDHIDGIVQMVQP